MIGEANSIVCVIVLLFFCFDVLYLANPERVHTCAEDFFAIMLLIAAFLFLVLYCPSSTGCP